MSTKTASDRRITRRRLIGTTAAAGAATVPGAAAARATRKRPGPSRRADVVVVGAGLAGSTPRDAR
jgi:hypothetical protein